jgi:hypothetical protein
MQNKIPVVYIGPQDLSEQFFILNGFDGSIFRHYVVEPVNAFLSVEYDATFKHYPNLVVGPGTAGCSLAHIQAQQLIEGHWKNPPTLNENQVRMGRYFGSELQALENGGFIFESDAVITNYGRKHFIEIPSLVARNDFKMIQLGGLKSTSGRKGQRIRFLESAREFYLSNLVRDLREDLLQVSDRDLIVVKGWIGGTHAYYVHSDAIAVLKNNQTGFLNAIDDYFKTVSWNTSWVGRTRQNLFIQSGTPSLIKEIGR